MPDFSYEDLAHSRGYNVICGIDEAGRGPLAGPVVAGAIILDRAKLPNGLIDGLDDSKKLKPARRKELFDKLKVCAFIGVGQSDVTEIDEINILKATHLAMRRAVDNLSIRSDIALVDGNTEPRLPFQSECIVQGDNLSLSIAAASIIAKVSRDKIMANLAYSYPVYGWERNAGYGTSEHLKAIEKYGVTMEHRKTFAPIKKYLASKYSRF
jgi:ribonuclease HII